MANRNNNTPHILNTSATLLGLCFIVLTSLKVASKTAETVIDELTAIATVLFMAASLLSFISMRATGQSNRLEKAADILFLSGLLSLFVTIMLLVFNIIQ